MASRQHPRSLADLPEELLANIAGRVGSTSNRPMADLSSLRATCKRMLHSCRDREVGKHLALDRVPILALQDDDPDGYDAFIRSLAQAGNTVALFLAGMDDIFGRNRSPRPPLDKLHRAAEGGHRGAAYVAAVFMYTANSGADADAKAISYMKQVEAEMEDGWCPGLINNLHSLHLRRRAVDLSWRLRSVALRRGLRRPTLPPAAARINVHHCAGPVFCGREPTRRGCCMYFCSDECRLRYECRDFFYRVKYRYI